MADVERQAGEHDGPPRRLTGFGFLPNKIRNHFIAWLGEFVGTFLFLFFAFAGTQVANAAANTISTATPDLAGTSDVSVVLYIALAFGFSLAVNAWVFFRISGGLFNPAVTLGLCIIGAVPIVRGIVVFTAQILGAIASAAVVSGLFPGPMAVRTSLGQDASIVRGLFIEMFATVMLIFTIFMLAAEKHKSTFLAPVGIGLALFIAELAAVPYTGGSLNPARTFGPSVVLGQFNGYDWIYWVGPFLGALVAAAFYHFVKILEYETANPGQDFDEHEAEETRQRSQTDGTDEAHVNFKEGSPLDGGPVTKEDVRRPIVGFDGTIEPIRSQRSRSIRAQKTDARQPRESYQTNAAPRTQPTHNSMVNTTRRSTSLDYRPHTPPHVQDRYFRQHTLADHGRFAPRSPRAGN